MNTINEPKELLIVSVSPQNLERGDLWFKENAAAISKARKANPWWRDNALVLEKDLTAKPSLLIRQLIDLGYERASIVRSRGLLAVRGGTIEIWPINADAPYLIEFRGNAIAGLYPRRRPAAEVKLQSPRVKVCAENLPVGSFLVHADHGIGIFRGIFGGVSSENPNFFIIEYAPPAPGREPDRLLVPVDQKNRLAPYIGFTTPTVHRLGGMLWSNTKRRVREDAEKLARSLLSLYAGRQNARRPAHAPDPNFIRELRATFAFAETEGQSRAEEEILRDLGRERPMDRLLCGDVGFGKTEVAVRAATAVISSGKQAAILAPTTVLAAQHERTFGQRLNALPIKIAMLSRLLAPKDERRTLQEAAEGKIDCVIGTHRLLSKDVIFKNLGLVIIDEEQRFGVKQKERFKELRAEVDVLSLSATPIPRTLSLALAGLRDISRIETPPSGRVPVVTAVLPYGEKIIRQAVWHELARGGQVYFLHNRIETIGQVQRRLTKLLTKLSFSDDRSKVIVSPRVGVIHGRMPEKELVHAMEAFRKRQVNILLATTIIENGLDISSANTLIVDDATRLGLAQAHQLRGRIGRGSEQAFAYFLYRPQRLTRKAEARLEALKEYTGLGAGYDIALRDLEIRGAGNILGREQSGAINKVGLNLYCQILSEAVEEAHVRQ